MATSSLVRQRVLSQREGACTTRKLGHQESGCARSKPAYDVAACSLGTTGTTAMPANMRRTRAWILALPLLALSPSAFTADSKTSKERLSDKAADEQRVDNCRVPVERRGTVPRPDCGEIAPRSDASKTGENEGKQSRP